MKWNISIIQEKNDAHLFKNLPAIQWYLIYNGEHAASILGKRLRKTEIGPHLHEDISLAKNQIYCGSRKSWLNLFSGALLLDFMCMEYPCKQITNISSCVISQNLK